MRTLAADLKRTSVLRRLPALRRVRCAAARGRESDVCAFEWAPEASPIEVEAVTGRAMILVPGDVFLATAGYRESTRWVVGGIPDGGLVPGINYWVLGACPNSHCSILSESDSSLGYEQVFSSLEYRSDAASAAECAGLCAERPCLAVYR